MGNMSPVIPLPHLSGLGTAKAVRWLTALGIAVVVGLLAFGGVVLLDARRDAWERAEQASANLALALERDIHRNILNYDLILQGTIHALSEPGINEVPRAIRRLAIFDSTSSAEFLGSMLVLDAKGNIIDASTSEMPPSINLADRDYFKNQQASPDLGLYISRAFASRLRGGSLSIALSRRINAPDGSFAGIVVGTMRLDYFDALFSRLELGQKGSVTLMRDDGRVVARKPYKPEDVDRDLSGTAAVQHFLSAPSGTFIGTSILDGVERHYTFRRLHGLPLILSLAMAVEDISAAWEPKAIALGTLLLLLCGATMALCLLFRRELLRRLEAENALEEAAQRLSTMASTDGLTGLANRRQFDLSLRREWQLGLREHRPLSLLMIDADHFKAYNDRYGHQEGDQVLVGIAGSILGAVSRPADLGARYGGEEFALLLPDTDAQAARDIGEKLREAIEALGIPHTGNPAGRVTTSIGVGTLIPRPDATETQLLKQADEALYKAKAEGRNRVRAGIPETGPAWSFAPLTSPANKA